MILWKHFINANFNALLNVKRRNTSRSERINNKPYQFPLFLSLKNTDWKHIYLSGIKKTAVVILMLSIRPRKSEKIYHHRKLLTEFQKSLNSPEGDKALFLENTVLFLNMFAASSFKFQS